MRKALAVVVFVAAVSGLAGASSIPDGLECAQTGTLGKLITYNINPANPDNADRFAICVTDGVSYNGAELYIGGEFQPELSSRGAFCGAVILGGRVLNGKADWDRVSRGVDPRETTDDLHVTCD